MDNRHKEHLKKSEKEFFLVFIGVAVLLGFVYITYVMPQLKNGKRKELEPKYSPSQSNPVELGPGPIGPIIYTVDAGDPAKWVYFDFSRASIVQVDDETKDPWDLKLQRTRLWFNQNKGKPGAKGLARHALPMPEDPAYGIKLLGPGKLEDYINEEITPGKFSREIAQTGKWYNYQWIPTYLYPNKEVYAVHTSDGRDILFALQSYYCNGERMGCLTFSYYIKN